nr:immunoglobulin heavy chain junction region [Macaca mulatta]MOX61233.1 immunoglobulin heavy chain junction region [Macaca mulatta]MOX61418.1 immunoglobulin heavy chain junction region [Macaca mulatta]MOX62801.1 immunoglobulin heavy chain junction region [Macaca mulatta]MOX65201.1 immunoglobulin heavy chain junction region [Macaca mulatta]
CVRDAFGSGFDVW